MPDPPLQPPATTADFEYLLDKTHVVAVDYDPRDTTVRAWVSQKVSPLDLSNEDLIANNVPDAFDTDVLDVGYGEDRPGFDPADLSGEDVAPDATTPDAPSTERQQRHRPIQGGLSENHHGSTAATGGLLAVVADPTQGAWGDDIAPGSLVRVSNNHVYANAGQADFGDAILQPAPMDGGTDEDIVGGLAGHVPLAEGVDVDIAARTVSLDRDTTGPYAMPNVLTGVMRAGYHRLQDVRVRKGGRTTGITDGRITAVNATVRVNYRNEDLGDDGVVRMPNQLLATNMSAGGDSGSHVFVAPDAEGAPPEVRGHLIGELYAGGESTTVINKAGVVERRFGLSYMPDTVTTFDGEEVSIPMATPSVELLETSVPGADESGAPAAGETATVTCRVDAAYQLPVWVRAVGPAGAGEAEVTPPDDAHEDGSYTVDVDVAVDAPSEYRDAFTVVLEGGYKLTDEHLADA